MGNRLSKIVTRTGDDGKTSVEPGKRISKNSYRIDALGMLDELNCVVGLVVTQIVDNEIKKCLTDIQQDLFNLGGELCPPHHTVITEEKVLHLEKLINYWNEQLPPLKEFILPCGSLAVTSCHLARAVCRRAERSIVALHEEKNLSDCSLQYLNRLSDLLFIIARILAKEENLKEVLWKHERKKTNKN